MDCDRAKECKSILSKLCFSAWLEELSVPHVGLLDHEESVDHSGLFVEERPFGDTIAWVHRVDSLSSGRRFLQR